MLATIFHSVCRLYAFEIDRTAKSAREIYNTKRHLKRTNENDPIIICIYVDMVPHMNKHWNM